MSQKAAKRLRKIAIGMVVAAEQNQPGLQIKRESYQITKKGTISVAKNTWKGAYKGLKKAVKTGKVTP